MSPLKLRYTQSRRQWWTHRKRYRGHKGAEETPPERLDAKVVAHFLRVCDEIWGYGEKERLTSMENNTPPIGEPNATATPAALAAVTISRIFPKCTNKQSPSNNQRNTVYLGYVKTAQRVQPRGSRHNMQRAQTALLCRPTAQKL